MSPGPEEAGTSPSSEGRGSPSGDGLGTYEWLQRGLGLLEDGHAAAAATVLERVASQEPRSASVLEALGRAQLVAGRPGAAVRTFEQLAEIAPDSDYARFGYGTALRRLGRLPQAAEQLALAVAMRPQRTEYVEALTRVRELLQPRADEGGGAPAGPPPDQVDPGLVVVTREPRLASGAPSPGAPSPGAPSPGAPSPGADDLADAPGERDPDAGEQQDGDADDRADGGGTGG
ncbi:tetratricopeptide repeat protein [Pseudokineococcus sp. 1T1Z-3]|uniref:tetratricopeptide repeat protein n=1 Tax=Pseudokineococcus sp. 1T1Z-3 TaxID=3132745 RepID=UPI0030A08403